MSLNSPQEVEMLLEVIHSDSASTASESIRHQTSTPPINVPPGHVGPLTLSGTGRTVWWTGRVAIGLRYQPQRVETVTQSALWVQKLVLGGSRNMMAA